MIPNHAIWLIAYTKRLIVYTVLSTSFPVINFLMMEARLTLIKRAFKHQVSTVITLPPTQNRMAMSCVINFVENGFLNFHWLLSSWFVYLSKQHNLVN